MLVVPPDCSVAVAPARMFTWLLPFTSNVPPALTTKSLFAWLSILVAWMLTTPLASVIVSFGPRKTMPASLSWIEYWPFGLVSGNDPAGPVGPVGPLAPVGPVGP